MNDTSLFWHEISLIISICDKKNVFFFRPLSNFAQFEWFVNFALILGSCHEKVKGRLEGEDESGQLHLGLVAQSHRQEQGVCVASAWPGEQWWSHVYCVQPPTASQLMRMEKYTSNTVTLTTTKGTSNQWQEGRGTFKVHYAASMMNLGPGPWKVLLLEE